MDPIIIAVLAFLGGILILKIAKGVLKVGLGVALFVCALVLAGFLQWNSCAAMIQ